MTDQLTCPACRRALERGDVDGVPVDECPTCHGLWFTEEGLHRVIEREDENLEWRDTEIWRREEQIEIRPEGPGCPSCERALATLEYGNTGVRLGFCPHCNAVWLERGDLERMLEALRHEVAGMSSAELLAATLHEAGEFLSGHQGLLSEWRHLRQILRLLGLRLMIESPGLRQAVLQTQRGTPFG